MIFDRVGVLTEDYTAANYTDGLTPLQGTVYFDRAAGAKYIFLRNNGATAITANLCAQVAGTDLGIFACTAATAANTLNFAGARVSSADSLEQDERGWFQIGGPASLLADAAGTTADRAVIFSNATAGRVETLVTTDATLVEYIFGIAETTTVTGAVDVNLTHSAWGL